MRSSKLGACNHPDYLLLNGKKEIMIIKRGICVLIISLVLCICYSNVYSADILRVLTWEGYVLPEEVKEVNRILKKRGYPHRIKVIFPYAEGAEQMFRLIREKNATLYS